jgi:hypothetical protein
MDREQGLGRDLLLIAIIASILFLVSVIFTTKVDAANPVGPDSLTLVSNETKETNSNGSMINISGGRIATININATIQNPRWKAFVGNIIGKFTLQDSSGSTIYDWSLSILTGRIHATRTSGTVTWASINCSNITTLNQESINMNNTNPDDNLTVTFNTTAGATHSAFYVGTRYISANTCPTLNVYRNNASSDSYWEEMALYDTSNIVYTSLIDENEVGFDGQTYDLQMIVPENGLPSFTGSTAYYLYIELGTS